jgi:GNAT superfamily N-acetyltransferase
MARLACTLDGARRQAQPTQTSPHYCLVRQTSRLSRWMTTRKRVGAAWWHTHEPPLLINADDEPLPELAMTVVEGRRSEGIGRALVEALARQAAQRHDALTLNVHLRNLAVGLCRQTGFRVAGAGRGRFGVARSRSLHPDGTLRSNL